MKNLLNDLTSVFIRMNRLLLFLLIACPISIKFYSPNINDQFLFNKLIAGFGGACLLCWIYAIAQKSNEKLDALGIYIKSFRFFNWIVGAIVLISIFLLFFSTTINSDYYGLKLKYPAPLFLFIVNTLLFMIAIFYSSKALVSVEQKREASFGESFTTSLLILFSAFGLWYIQPRVKNI